MCSERAKFTQLRETFTQHQKSHQHLEKEVAKRKEREAELLALVERSEWEAKVHQLAGTSLVPRCLVGGGGGRREKKESLNK